MNVRSLGYRTDLIFPAFDGEIVDRGDYLVVRTPSNPTFYWGNFLLFAQPPQEGDFEKWRELSAKEIGAPPTMEHQAFGWDSPEGDAGVIEPFVQAGFGVNHDVVMTAKAPHAPSRSSTAVTVRPLSSDSEWAQAVDLQTLIMEPGHEKADFRLFRERQMERYRKMAGAGLGNWYGAFLEDRLVADLGVFHDGQGLARYQSIETHPDFRQRGIAGTLIYEAARHAIAQHGLHTLVIIAEADGGPARLYQSLGFAPTEKSVGALWWQRKGEDVKSVE